MVSGRVYVLEVIVEDESSWRMPRVFVVSPLDYTWFDTAGS
jgi:hypothetical protein